MNGDTHELWVDGEMVAFIVERPRYCERGRFHALCERGEIPIDSQGKDVWPRYYFILEFAKAEIECWLVWHNVPIGGGEWRFNPAPPGTVDMDALVNGRVEVSK